MLNKNKERGITIIVLVITIIVMLILAAVTINASMGDNNSSIERAKNATDNYNNAVKNEQNQINDAKGTKLNIDNLIANSGNTGYPVYNGENGNNSENGESGNQGISLSSVDYLNKVTPEIKNQNGVELISAVCNNNKINMRFDEWQEGFEGFNLALNNLTIGNKYKIKFRNKSNNSYFEEYSYGIWFGYKVSQDQVSDYQQYDGQGYTTMQKNREDDNFKDNEIEFTATAQKEYLVFNLAGFADDTRNTLWLNDFEIEDTSDSSNITSVNITTCLNIQTLNQLTILSENGITVEDEQWSNGNPTVKYKETSAGFEGFNIRIKNLTPNKTYNISFEAKSNGEYYPEDSYGKFFGYKISQSPINNYSLYDDQGYTQLNKSEEYQEYTLEFTATDDVAYLVFNVAGFSDETTNYLYIKDIEITEKNET